jgi:16S rRNA (uracil1498-N3)-methyltransferase
MQLPYFFEPHLSASFEKFILSEDTGKHCIQVLRMQAGEQLQLTDGKGKLITAAIMQADKKNCTVEVIRGITVSPPVKETAIGISLLKNAARFEWFLEKATEIGIRTITPLICQRTERQHYRQDRLNNILVSAMLQSRQAWLPVLQEPVVFSSFIPSANYRQQLIAHCMEENKQALPSINIKNNVLLLIGPEGDFTAGEIELALQHGFQPVSLGATRLRTETAGIVAATLLTNSFS